VRRFEQLVKTVKASKKILIVGHQNADPDAVCSAYLLSRAVKHINRRLKVTAVSPDGVSKVSARVLTQLSFEVADTATPADFDAIFTVDTNTLQQLGSLRQPIETCGKPLIVIDHHAIHPETRNRADVLISDDKATSACEVVLKLCTAAKLRLTKRDALAAFLGIAYETGHFTIATTRSLKLACRLLEVGVDGTEALKIIRVPMDNSERIARLKSARRMNWESIGGWLVASTVVGSFHASVARSLIGLGAHLAIVGGEKKDRLTLSFRSTGEFFAGTNFHLGRNLATILGETTNGAGGGHSTAAGATAQGNLDEAIKKSVELFRTYVDRDEKTPAE
jgi:nanoRNase/pAp phosphatase (c-di-AMP/oligoRNAs hydrolase)